MAKKPTKHSILAARTDARAKSIALYELAKGFRRKGEFEEAGYTFEEAAGQMKKVGYTPNVLAAVAGLLDQAGLSFKKVTFMEHRAQQNFDEAVTFKDQSVKAEFSKSAIAMSERDQKLYEQGMPRFTNGASQVRRSPRENGSSSHATQSSIVKARVQQLRPSGDPVPLLQWANAAIYGNAQRPQSQAMAATIAVAAPAA